MKFTLDDPEEVLEYVREPLSAVREALDDGISYADSVLKGDLPYDAHY